MAHAFGLGASPLVTGAHGVEMPGVELHASVELSVSEESRESASRQPGVVTSAIVERHVVAKFEPTRKRKQLLWLASPAPAQSQRGPITEQRA
eukprot:scaffold10110_cov69-Phaeocystis_antarctica.AAC.14